MDPTKVNSARRITISFPADMEASLVALRKTDTYCRMSWSELIRSLIEIGLEHSVE